MKINNTTLTTDKLEITIQHPNKLHSKTFKRGYYNDTQGIYLYDQKHTRKQLSCFHLTTITINKTTIETEWTKQWKKDTILTFTTTEEDTLTLSLDDPSNIFHFCDDYDYLFNTCYKTHPPLQNFHEYLTILLHEIYHQFNVELYSLYSNKQPYTLDATGTICMDGVRGTVTILDNKENMVKDGTLTVTCGENTNTTDLAKIYEETGSTIYPWTIVNDEEENIIITYTNLNGVAISTELDKNGLPILPTSEIILNDVTMQYGDNVKLPLEIVSNDESIINEGTVILRYKQGTRTVKTITKIPVINGSIDVDILPLKPATYTIQADYRSNGGYEDSTATATLTINKGDVHFQLDTNNLCVTVHGVAVVDAVLLDQNDNPVTSHRNECALKYGGKTSLFQLEEDGHVPEYIKTDVFLNHSYDYEVHFVAGLNKYWNEVRNSYPVTTEQEPVWDLFARTINGNPGLELITIGFPPEQVVTAYIDDVNVGEFIIQDNTDVRDGEGTATIELSDEYAGNQVVTLKTTFAGYMEHEYTKEFNITI